MMKKLLILMVFTLFALTSCDKDKAKDTTETENTITQSIVSPEVSKPDGNNNNSSNNNSGEDNNSNEDTDNSEKVSSYEVIESSYIKGEDIIVEYPQVTGLIDTSRQDTINELIEKDATKYVKLYEEEGGYLDISYEIAWKGSNLLSIKYTVYSNFRSAAHPNHMFFATNIDIKNALKIRLTDMVNIDEMFVQKLIKDGVYVAPHEGNEEIINMLKEEISKIDINSLLVADYGEGDIRNYSYFTEDSLGISIELPFVVGGYALYELKYEDIRNNINVKNDMWNDFPELDTDAINSLIPEGWSIIELFDGSKALVEGDLNKDDITDIAFAIEDKGTDKEVPLRSLVIATGNKDKTYSLSVVAENAILRSDEGGVWGDPFEGISIKKGSIYLNFYGGSAWRWGYSYQFRYQEDDWYLIGATESVINVGNNEGTDKDYNLLTGDYIITECNEVGNKSITKGNKDKRNMFRLKDFYAGSEDVFDFE